MEDLEARETAQTEEKGYWIFVDNGRYRCSECGCETHVDELMYRPIYEFCPYCGKPMIINDK